VEKALTRPGRVADGVSRLVLLCGATFWRRTMNRFSRWILVVAAAAVAAPATQAQQRGQRGPGGGRMSAVFLLGQKSVQDDLKLSQEQVSQVTQLAQKQTAAFIEARKLEGDERQKKIQELTQANERALADVLKPDQLKRLKQIALQVALQRGPQAFGEAEVADALGLSGEQKDKLKAIIDDAQKEMSSLPRGPESQKKREEIGKAAADKAMEVLTAEQRTKWKDMLGEPFKGEITRPGRPGGNRPAGKVDPLRQD
jgi:hypothetical protein